ncbi:MAG: FecR domain-containing protein [Pseudomonadota bacterium]
MLAPTSMEQTHSTAARIRKEAHEWRRKLAEPDFSTTQRAELHAWLQADVRNRRAFERAETVWQALGQLQRSDIEAAYLQPSWQERLWSIRTAFLSAFHYKPAVSAMALISMVMLSAGIYWSSSQPPMHTEALSYSSPVGQVSTYSLADGTLITLGAGSLAEVSFTTEARRIILINGDGYFDVAPDSSRPFSVRAGSLTATAIGTEFDVRYNGGVSRVAVAEGEVSVHYPLILSGELSAIFTSESLTEGQQVDANPAEGLSDPSMIELERISDWRDRRLRYSGATLTEVIADAKRYSHRRLLLLDPNGEVANRKVTAFFDGGDIDGLLTTLPDIMPLRVTEAHDGNVLIEPL